MLSQWQNYAENAIVPVWQSFKREECCFDGLTVEYEHFLT